MQMRNLKVPISLGELIDKITILRIKSNKINSNEAQKNIRSELEKLEHILNTKMSINTNLKNFEIKLSKINQSLWDIEDQLREKEREKKFESLPVIVGLAVGIVVVVGIVISIHSSAIQTLYRLLFSNPEINRFNSS